VAGTGSYLPERLLTNADLEKLVDTDDAWIVERTGIEQRHMADDGVLTSDLALEAARRALAAAGLAATDLDMIIFATVSPDQAMPSAACVLQHKLGARPIMAFDLSAACSGFVYALGVADQFIGSGQARHVLVVGAEILHRYIDYTDRETCILFGDGAGAFVVSRAEGDQASAILSMRMQADGSLGDLFVLPAGGSALPLSQHVLDNGLHFVRMKGREIFKHAVRTMVQCCQSALEEAGLESAGVDWLIPHQANMRILESVAKYFDFPREKVVVNLPKTGNTSAATIPVAFDEAVRDGRICRGQTILLTAFGAGVTGGAIALRY
jgi:3-oxoacyl-[acyl-carrier-protein] synthase-3